MSGSIFLFEILIVCGLVFAAQLCFNEPKKNDQKKSLQNNIELFLLLAALAILLVVFGNILGQYQAAKAGHLLEGSMMSFITRVVDDGQQVAALTKAYATQAKAMMAGLAVCAAASILVFTAKNKTKA
ncbi:hypothetical protein JW935_04065 [candidate division KSB1 bacterium]|nr:hypothetical protein [candidate division KSB1 bacterium]